MQNLQKRNNAAKSRPPASSPLAAGRRRPIVIRGWSEFSRNGASLIREVEARGVQIEISTNPRMPQMRLRPASRFAAEISSLAPENFVSFQNFLRHLSQYRTLVFLDEKFVISTDKFEVVADRHPGCPHDVIDIHLKRRSISLRDRRLRAASIYSKRSSEGVEQIIATVQALSDEKREILNVLKRIEERCTLTDDDRKLLERIRMKEGAEAALQEFRRPHEGHLERVALD